MELGEIASLSDEATVEVKRLDVDQHIYTVTQDDSTVMLTASELRELCELVEDDL